LATLRREVAEPAEAVAAVQEFFGGELRFGDRLAAALPAVDGFVRWLSFPFSDPKKLAAALPFELGSQLPVSVELCLTDFQPPQPSGEQSFAVTAAAVRRETIAAFLAPFDAAAVPLQVLDLAPFATAGGLAPHLGDGLLATLGEQDLTLVRLRAGRVTDLRLLPAGGSRPRQEQARFILREAALLQRGESEALPLWLIGPGVDETLLGLLRLQFPRVEIPQLLLDGEPLAAEFLPAAALALQAARPEKERGFNFRRGPFALKSEWAAMKRRLLVVGSLLLLIVLTAGGAAYFAYAQRAARAEALQQAMVKVFRETFPGSTPLVDVPLQMRSGLNELRKRGQLGGAAPAALAVLQEISRRTPAELTVDIRDLSYGPDAVRLEGSTSSFDAINQLAKSLEASPLFGSAQIADAKMSIEGNRVDFRLTLSLSATKEGS
jgi:general secretion pathway protein L